MTPAEGEQGMQMWVADMRDAPATKLFRCDCERLHHCEYHSADWTLILAVTLGAFRATCGDGPVDYYAACDRVLTEVEVSPRLRSHRLALDFARSLFDDPMYASADQWTNGQHRGQAMRDAGQHFTLFAD